MTPEELQAELEVARRISDQWKARALGADDYIRILTSVERETELGARVSKMEKQVKAARKALDSLVANRSEPVAAGIALGAKKEMGDA